jgi:hypothetical protein
MTRREFAGMGLAAVTALGVQGVSVRSATAQQKEEGGHRHHDEAMRACAQACSACQHECDACGTHCAHLVSKGNSEHLTTLMTCQDCADFCASAAQIVARGGPFADLICASCADACARCEKECDKFKEDKFMQRCAEECRKCEKACRTMLKHLHA